MKRKLLAAMLSLVMLLTLLPTTAFAAVTVDDHGVAEVTSAAELKEALNGTATTIKLANDVTSTDVVRVTKDVLIDLNGHDITRTVNVGEAGSWNYAIAVNGGNLTLTSSASKVGNINITTAADVVVVGVQVYNGTLNTSNVGINVQTSETNTGAVGVYVIATNNYNATFDMNNGTTIKTGSTSYQGDAYAVYVQSTESQNGVATFNMNDGNIISKAQDQNTTSDGDGHGVYVAGNGTAGSAVFNMKGGKIDAQGFGVSGSAFRGGTVMDITGGVVNGDTMAIFHSMEGKLTIKNATLTGKSGIEVKKGNVTIDDGTNIVVTEQGKQNLGRTTSDEEQYNANSSNGYAVALVNNKLAEFGTDPVTVTLNGGNYNSRVAILDDNNETFVSGGYTIKAADGYKTCTLNIYGGNYEGSIYKTGKPLENYNDNTRLSADKASQGDNLTIYGGFFKYIPFAPYNYVAGDYIAVKQTTNDFKIVAASNMTSVEKKDPTCEEAGNKAYYEIDGAKCYKYDNYTDDYGSPVGSAVYVVANDDFFKIAALGHEWNDGQVTQSATTDTDGVMTYQCMRTNCNKEKTEAIAATKKHDGAALVHHAETTPNCATQTDGNIEYWSCSTCEKNFTQSDDGSFVECTEDVTIKWAHDAESVDGVAPTCTKTGLTEGNKCNTCGAIIKAQATIAATGHKYSSEWTTTDAQHWHACTNISCEEKSDLADHTWNAGVVTKAATYSETGTKLYTCTICGKTKTETIAKKTSSGSSSGGSGSSSTTYKVTVESASNGSAKVSASTAAKGTTVTVTLSPNDGYKLDKLTVTDGSGKTVSTTKKSDTVYTFTMPASQVKVGVTYVKEDSTVVEPTTGFDDVTSADWFAEAVKYVADKGMMNGTSKTTFGPKSGTTRGMIVTVLYRLENEPSTSATSFTDVESGAYYANAVAWANANGVVSGYGNGKFGPNDSITREQLAAILYRYAQYKKYDVSVGEDTNIMDFDDVRQISSYAVPAIQWACGASVMNGKSTTTLDPKGGATRAEVAAMLMRFCENVK